MAGGKTQSKISADQPAFQDSDCEEILSQEESCPRNLHGRARRRGKQLVRHLLGRKEIPLRTARLNHGVRSALRVEDGWICSLRSGWPSSSFVTHRKFARSHLAYIRLGKLTDTIQGRLQIAGATLQVRLARVLRNWNESADPDQHARKRLGDHHAIPAVQNPCLFDRCVEAR